MPTELNGWAQTPTTRSGAKGLGPPCVAGSGNLIGAPLTGRRDYGSFESDIPSERSVGCVSRFRTECLERPDRP